MTLQTKKQKKNKTPHYSHSICTFEGHNCFFLNGLSLILMDQTRWIIFSVWDKLCCHIFVSPLALLHHWGKRKRVRQSWNRSVSASNSWPFFSSFKYCGMMKTKAERSSSSLPDSMCVTRHVHTHILFLFARQWAAEVSQGCIAAQGWRQKLVVGRLLFFLFLSFSFFISTSHRFHSHPSYFHQKYTKDADRVFFTPLPKIR